VEDLWNQFSVALKNYQEATEECKKAFEDLKARDEKSAREIDMQMRKLQRIQVFFQLWNIRFCAVAAGDYIAIWHPFRLIFDADF